jgi:hypothetical protein
VISANARLARALGLALSLAIALAATPQVAHACAVCSRGDPLAPAAEGHGRGGDLRIALDAEVLSQRSASPGVVGMHDAMDEYVLKLTGAYSPTPTVNLVVSVPFTRKKMTMEHGGGVAPFVASDLTGVGDLEVGGRWFFFESVSLRERLRQGVALSAGTSLPTGPSAARTDVGSQPITQLGLPNAQHEQIGSGAFGPYAGLSYRLQRDPFTGLLSVSGRLHTENAQGYRYGDSLLWTLQGQWAPVRWVALGLGLDGHNGGRDRQSGAPVENTGGLVLWASPSVFMNVYQRLWVTLRVQLPFYTSLVGDQSLGPVVLGGVQYELF